MGDWDKYQKFDILDWLEDEEDCAEYIRACIEDNADEDEMEEAYRDCERARAVHGFGPKTETKPEICGSREVASVGI